MHPGRMEFWYAVLTILKLMGSEGEEDFFQLFSQKSTFIKDIHIELTRRERLDDWCRIFYHMIKRLGTKQVSCVKFPKTNCFAGYNFWYSTDIPYIDVFNNIQAAFKVTVNEATHLTCCKLVSLFVSSLSDQLGGMLKFVDWS